MGAPTVGNASESTISQYNQGRARPEPAQFRNEEHLVGKEVETEGESDERHTRRAQRPGQPCGGGSSHRLLDVVSLHLLSQP